MREQLTEQQRKDSAAECRRMIAEAEQPGAGYRTVEKGRIARIALASLEAEPEYNTSDAEDINLDVSKAAYDRCHSDYRWISYPAPPVPVMKPVQMPTRIANIHLRSPLEVEDLYRDFMAAAIRCAGGEVAE